MAEVIFKHLLKTREVGNEWLVGSAGLHGMKGLAAVPMAEEACRLAGYDLSSHLSTPLSAELMNDFNLILVMEKWQQEQIQQYFPTQVHKTHLLSAMAGLDKDILDPHGSPFQYHQDTLADIEQYLSRGFPKIARLANK